MQPIHYSLIINVLTLAIGGWLALAFGNAWILIVIVLLAQHTMARFGEAEEDEDSGGENEPRAGFTADFNK